METEIVTPVAARIVPTVREASFEDFGQIASLQEKHGLGAWTEESWRDLWVGNPAYIERQKEWPIGWVLKTGREIVGYLGNIPAFYELDGKRLLAACAHSWVVASDYRGYALLLLDQYLGQKQADLCIASTVSQDSSKPLIAMGALPVPAGTWNESCVWITRYRSFVASWLARKKYPVHRLSAYPISAGLFLRDAVLNRRIRKKMVHNVEIECCESFDDRFDRFWEELRAQNPDKLLAVRSRATLEWHFRIALREKRIWAVTGSEKKALRAYAIFMVQRVAANGVRRLTLVDFQGLADKAALFYPILTWALERCRHDGIHLLESIGLRPPGLEDISRLAPYHLKQDAWAYWYKAHDRSLAAVLCNPDVWLPSPFDGDASVGLV